MYEFSVADIKPQQVLHQILRARIPPTVLRMRFTNRSSPRMVPFTDLYRFSFSVGVNEIKIPLKTGPPKE